jgi:hypothetical protein
MSPDLDGQPVDLSCFPALRGVLDVVYNPLRTALTEQARALGIPCANGLRMLAEQFSQAPTVEAYSAVLRCLRDSVVYMAGTMRTSGEPETETFKPDLADNGRHKFLPVFSSGELAETAAQKDSVIREAPFLDTLALAEADSEVAGLVLDAMSRPFIVEKDLFDAIRALPSILAE